MSNPIFWQIEKNPLEDSEFYETMNLKGTIIKSIILFLAVLLWTIFWYIYNNIIMQYFWFIIIIDIIILFIIIFKPESSKNLAIPGSILKWLVLWWISFMFEQKFDWIILQTIFLTFGIFTTMLFLFAKKIIKVSEKLKLVIITSTIWIWLIYLISIIGNLTWFYSIPYIHENWIFWIIFSLFVVWIASLNFLLDFDLINEMIEKKQDKYYEWYVSYWLIITFVWLYLEILKLIWKIESSNSD